VAYLQRHGRPPAARPRLPAPVCSEPRAMPSEQGVRLDDRQRRPNIREQPPQADENQSVGPAEGRPLWPRSPQNIDLLPQHQVLSLKRHPRSEQADHRPPDQSAKVPHLTTASPDSRSLTSRTSFPTGTLAPASTAASAITHRAS